MTDNNRGEDQNVLPNINDADLCKRLEQLSQDELNELPFGVIHLDADGSVTFFSKTEAKLSGFGDRNAIGRAFFTELAPCMGTPDLLKRMDNAEAKGTFDMMFEHVGDFDDADGELLVRVTSASNGGFWVVNERYS